MRRERSPLREGILLRGLLSRVRPPRTLRGLAWTAYAIAVAGLEATLTVAKLSGIPVLAAIMSVGFLGPLAGGVALCAVDVMAGIVGWKAWRRTA